MKTPDRSIEELMEKLSWHNVNGKKMCSEAEVIYALQTERQRCEEMVEVILKDFSKWADEKIEEDNDYDFEDGGDPEYRDRRNAIQNQKQSCYRQAKSHLQALTQPNNPNNHE